MFFLYCSKKKYLINLSISNLRFARIKTDFCNNDDKNEIKLNTISNSCFLGILRPGFYIQVKSLIIEILKGNNLFNLLK